MAIEQLEQLAKVANIVFNPIKNPWAYILASTPMGLFILNRGYESLNVVRARRAINNNQPPFGGEQLALNLVGDGEFNREYANHLRQYSKK